MSTPDRGGLKAAFRDFAQADSDKEAELKLLGRAIEPGRDTPKATAERPHSYPVATTEVLGSYNSNPLIPRPLLQREPVRQLSFRCPVSLTSELRLKSTFNQLEQQQIIIEGLRRVLAELSAPPEGWQEP